jgi:hypothetical protein
MKIEDKRRKIVIFEELLFALLNWDLEHYNSQKSIRSYFNVTKRDINPGESAEQVVSCNSLFEKKVKVEFRNKQESRYGIYNTYKLMTDVYTFLVDELTKCREQIYYINDSISLVRESFDIKKCPVEIDDNELSDIQQQISNAYDNMIWQLERYNFHFSTINKKLDDCFNRLTIIANKYGVNILPGEKDDKEKRL